MIADLKPYPEYKESGSKWLGRVPEHWEVRNLRTLIRSRNERNRTDLPLLSVAREKGVFVRSLTDAGENHNVIPEDLSNYKVARVGNLVINKMKAWQGSMGIAPCDGIVSPAYYVFDFGIENRVFGQTLLRSKPYVAHFGQASDGVRVGQWDLSIAGMRQIPVLVPPSTEQAAIVRFLNWANGRLERAIRAKRRIIKLLDEQKQVIIHRAVTRGLDPDVEMKPSGVEWLGNIPEHWDVRRCGSIFYEVVDTGHPNALLLSIDRFKGVIPQSETGRRTRASENRSSYKRVRPGQLAYNLMNAFMGALGFSDYDGIVSPAYAVAQSRQDIEPGYFHNLFRTSAYTSEFNRLSYGIMYERNRLYFERFKLVSTLIPPLAEQKEIVKWIREQTAGLNAAIIRFEREIDLLREFRTRLIADVVTGKLDVREAVATLPEEIAVETDAAYCAEDELTTEEEEDSVTDLENEN